MSVDHASGVAAPKADPVFLHVRAGMTVIVEDGIVGERISSAATMADLLNEFSEENNLDPKQVKSFFENLYGEFCSHINQASNVGQGVNLFRYWQANFKEESESNEDFIELLLALNEVGLVTDKAHKAMLLFLDYASEHKVIDIDCSKFVERK